MWFAGRSLGFLPCKHTHAEITAGADAGDWAQNKPGSTIAARRGGQRHELHPAATGSPPAGLGGFPGLSRRTHPCRSLKAGFPPGRVCVRCLPSSLCPESCDFSRRRTHIYGAKLYCYEALCTVCFPECIVGSLPPLPPYLPPTPDRYIIVSYNCSQCTKEETEAQRGYTTCLGHTAYKWSSQGPCSGSKL